MLGSGEAFASCNHFSAARLTGHWFDGTSLIPDLLQPVDLFGCAANLAGDHRHCQRTGDRCRDTRALISGKARKTWATHIASCSAFSVRRANTPSL